MLKSGLRTRTVESASNHPTRGTRVGHTSSDRRIDLILIGTVSADSHKRMTGLGAAPSADSRLRCAFIGQGIVLLRLIELLQERGHEVVGVFLNAPGPEAALDRARIPFCTDSGQLASFLTSSPIDLLFSVANKHVLRRQVIDHPRMMAINYHNGPLPAYAGLRAPAWAIHNGESTHGITWHRIAEKVDAGDILLQRSFPATPTETTASLNEKCTFAAVEGFAELLDGLESFGSDIPARQQDHGQWSYFGLKQTIPRAGIIDWSRHGTRDFGVCPFEHLGSKSQRLWLGQRFALAFGDARTGRRRAN